MKIKYVVLREVKMGDDYVPEDQCVCEDMSSVERVVEKYVTKVNTGKKYQENFKTRFGTFTMINNDEKIEVNEWNEDRTVRRQIMCIEFKKEA